MGQEGVKFRELLKAELSDVVAKLLYHNRKEDEKIPLGLIEEAIKKGIIQKEDLVNWFSDALGTMK